MIRLQESLGYKDGKPPRDIDVRFESYVKREPGGVLTLQALAFLKDLKQKGQLPGFSKKEQLWILKGEGGRLPFDSGKKFTSDIYPVVRAIFFQKQADPCTYYYVVERGSADKEWRLRKAFRGLERRVIEEY